MTRLGYGIVVATLMVVACGTDSVGTGPSEDGGLPPGTKDGGIDSGGGEDAGDAGTPEAATFSVGGTVTGLSGTGLVLQNNAGDDLPVAKDGTFNFSTKLAAGKPYDVKIKTQPSAPSQTCTVSGGSGVIVNGNVSSVTVNCATNKFTVGGTVSGLEGSGLVLQNNGGADLVINNNGTFSFATTLDSGAAYAVTVKTQPGSPTQTCVVDTGTGTVAGGNVTNVSIVCTTNEYKVGGTVSGLAGSGLVLQVNGGETSAVSTSGPFQFPTAIKSGAAYDVTINAQPSNPSQTCTVAGGNGTIGAADVTSVAVNCATNTYAIAGTVSGLLGSVTLQNNGGDDLVVTSGSGTFAFGTPIASGAGYAVTIKEQPGTPSQTCMLEDATGTVDSSAISNVKLTCITNTFKVKLSVNGLAGLGLKLQNNAGDDLSIGSDGTYEFVTPVASGQTYGVTVSAQPTDVSQTCTVSNATGTIGAADVTDVVVNCTTNDYTVGGGVAGLTGSGLVLQNNLGDDLPITPGATTFEFPAKVLSGGAYSVTIKTQPSNPSQTCSIAAGSGTVTNGNVVTAMVNCTTDTFAVGGSTSGLAGTGLVLQNNLGDDLTVNGNGNFAFATAISSGAAYSVTVKTQPTVPSQTCTVTNGTGNVGGGPVTNIAVACTTNSYKVGGTVTGLGNAGTLVLRNNGGDDLALSADGSFAFATSISSGSNYAVTIVSAPASKSCTVANGTGTVGAGPVASVAVSCVNFYGPSGVQKSVSEGSLSGWTKCWSDNFSTTTPISTVRNLCNKTKLLLGCKKTGTTTLTLAAWAPATDVFTVVNNCDNTPHNANGVGWYYSDSCSMGFAPQGVAINRLSCDYPAYGPSGDQKMCWHTGGANITSGWRCGNDNGNDGTLVNYERVIYQAP